jgi:hypothetical protein
VHVRHLQSVGRSRIRADRRREPSRRRLPDRACCQSDAGIARVSVSAPNRLDKRRERR